MGIINNKIKYSIKLLSHTVSPLKIYQRSQIKTMTYDHNKYKLNVLLNVTEAR